MTTQEIELKWQAALRKHFPGVIVKQVFHILDGDDLPDLKLYMIPDDRMRDFAVFAIDERAAFMKREALPDANLFECTVSQTRENHPEIWAEAQRELRRSGVAKKSKPALRKKLPARKAARRTPVVSR